jgi:AcrR family transcriptional regulator
MTVTDKKASWISQMSEYLLLNGLVASNLRPLAKAAGTSDRMLIYHFGSKEKLMEHLLRHLADTLSDQLNKAIPPGRAASRLACFEEIIGLLRTKEMRPVLAFRHDLIAQRAGTETHSKIARNILLSLKRWVLQRLPEDDPNPESTASYILVCVDGMLLMGAADAADLANEALATFAALEKQ